MSANNLSVLIVDDNSDKSREIAKGISAIEGFDSGNIQIVTTANDAKRLLKASRFDLLVIDIALPLRAGDEPNKEGGLQLLDEILSRDQFHRPRHVLGITAYEDTYFAALDRFGAELWSVIEYDATSEGWLELLQAKARHIRASEQSADVNLPNGFDICVLTALQDPELDAVLALPWNWSRHEVAGDPSVYFKGNYEKVGGEKGTVVAARASIMGMPAAAILATKMAMHFRPRVLVMVGICAGNSDEVNLGDVIAANPGWDYGNGKHSISEKGERKFAHSPYPVPMSTRIRSVIDRAQLDENDLSDIRKAFPGSKPTNILRLLPGPLASGAAVLADKDLFNEVKDLQHRKLLGVDMEAYAVLATAGEMPAPSPEVLVIKGVSDFADKDKDDKVRHYAAYTSAMILKHLVTSHNL